MITVIEGKHIVEVRVNHDTKMITITFTDGSSSIIEYTNEKLILKGGES